MRKVLFLLTLALLSSQLFGATPEQVKRILHGPKATVLLFVASQCPCTDQHRLIVSRLLEEAQPEGVKFYCVFSNYGETHDLINHFYRNIGWQMPFVTDPSSALADRYHVTNTPTAIVLGSGGSVVFQGPIDDSSKNQGRVDRAWLREALEDVLANREVRTPSVPPAGCWIVRKSDLEPSASVSEK